MIVFAWSLILFCISIIIHLIIWKIKLPKKHRATLLKIFSFILLLWYILIFLPVFRNPPSIFFLSIVQIAHISLFHIAITLAYVAAYVSIEADSPSLRITNCIFKKDKSGIGRDELFVLANMDKFFPSRISSMVLDKMVSLKNGKYRVANKGNFLVKIVIYYRNIMGVDKGFG